MERIFNLPQVLGKRRHLRNNQTFAEKIMWINLRKEKVLGIKFRRQFSIGPYIMDFYAPSIRLAIEVDGPDHDVPEKKAKDRIRQKWIEDIANVEFMRFTDAEVCNWPDKVVAAIEARIAAKISEISQPPQPLPTSPSQGRHLFKAGE